MQIMVAMLNVFVVFSAQVSFVSAVSHSELYPFGPVSHDSLLSRGDEAIISISELPNPFPFFGELHQKIFIINDGLISLSIQPVTSRPQMFPTRGHLIAPFWADVDTTLKGNVWFRVTTDQAVLQQAKHHLPNNGICSPFYLLVVTWDDVSYYRFHYDKTNTFQCILATDGHNSYAIFIYEQNGIHWTTGDASGGTFGILTEPNGVAAVVGINNDGNFTLAPSSGTQDVINISSTSNINVPGVWVFQLNGDRSAGCAIQPETHTETIPMGTLIPLISLGLIILVLLLGAIYGYFQVGRLIVALRGSNDQPIKRPLTEKLITKEEQLYSLATHSF